MFVAWVTSTHAIQYRATDGSGSWSAVRTIPNVTKASCVTLAQFEEANGNRFLWAIWATEGGAIVASATGDGVNWLSNTGAQPQGTTTRCPTAAAFVPDSSDHRIFIAWTEDDGSIYATTDTGTLSFTAKQQIAGVGTATSAPALESLLGSDQVLRLSIAWTASDGAVHFQQSQDGSAWGSDATVSATGATTRAPGLGFLQENGGNQFAWLGWTGADGSVDVDYGDIAIAWQPYFGLDAGSAETAPVLEAFTKTGAAAMWAAFGKGSQAWYATADGTNAFTTPSQVPGANDVVGPPAIGMFDIP
jgi:hypothetical protein